MNLSLILGPVAKAIAAGIMPVVVVLAAWLLDNTGIGVQIDVTVLETAVLAVLTAAATWLAPKNTTPDTTSTQEN